ncbi:MAG: ubiquitin [Oscillospiraceae bacterium]|nr:ubiquitin [Oscillospiraceae bacterium]
MTDLDKAEKLREKTGVSYAEAKEALDNSDGSLLDALVYLEKQGKVETPPGGGFYSGAGFAGDAGLSAQSRKRRRQGEGFESMLKRFGKFLLSLLNKGMANKLVAHKNNEHLFSIPVIIFLLLLFAFWITLPVFIITLFCGIRYRFSGPDLDRDEVNNVMNVASDFVDDVKSALADDDEDDDEDRDKHNPNKKEKHTQSNHKAHDDDDDVIYL